MNLKFYQLMEESGRLIRLQGASEDVVKNAFFSNYLAALLMLKLQDLKGLHLINDHANSKLTRFTNGMSDLNFWGRALFYSKDAEIKNRMMNGHAEILAKDAGRVVQGRIAKTMKVPLTQPKAVDWDDTVGSLLLYRERFAIKSSYFQKITWALANWDSLTDSDRRKQVNNAFLYLMQSDPKSALMSRLRNLSTSTMLNTISSLAMKLIGFKKIMEDEGSVATGTGSIGTMQGSSNSIITPPSFDKDSSGSKKFEVGNLFSPKKLSPNQVKGKGGMIIKDGKVIKRRVKGFHVRKFKAPDSLKAGMKELEGKK